MDQIPIKSAVQDQPMGGMHHRPNICFECLSAPSVSVLFNKDLRCDPPLRSLLQSSSHPYPLKILLKSFLLLSPPALQYSSLQEFSPFLQLLVLMSVHLSPSDL